MTKIRVAQIGFGLSGRYLQAPFFSKHPEFELHTVMTSQADALSGYPGVRRVEELEAVLSDPTIDLVSIASPNNTHFDYALQCLRAGKHVLVEKPFTATPDEARQIIAFAAAQKRHVFVFQNRRFDSDFRTVQQVVQSGVLGKIHRFEARFDRYKPMPNVKKWKETAGPGSGILYDLGSHIIDQAIALFGAPKGVWGEVYRQREGSQIEDAFDLRLQYDALQVQLSSGLLVREPTPRYVLHGDKGAFVKYGLDPQEDQLKAGLWPGMAGFGVESAEFRGILNAELNGLPFRGTIETLPGNWMLLFDNIADVLQQNAAPLIELEQVLAQVEVMAQVASRV